MHVFTETPDMATSVRLAPEIEKRLDFLANQTGRTKAFYLRQIIENGLDDLEDYYLARRSAGTRAER
jgi:RHH-type transcriptional regulator, rel operon repressor / antitoxin RelB